MASIQALYHSMKENINQIKQEGFFMPAGIKKINRIMKELDKKLSDSNRDAHDDNLLYLDAINKMVSIAQVRLALTSKNRSKQVQDFYETLYHAVKIQLSPLNQEVSNYRKNEALKKEEERFKKDEIAIMIRLARNGKRSLRDIYESMSFNLNQNSSLLTPTGIKEINKIRKALDQALTRSTRNTDHDDILYLEALNNMIGIAGTKLALPSENRSAQVNQFYESLYYGVRQELAPLNQRVNEYNKQEELKQEKEALQRKETIQTILENAEITAESDSVKNLSGKKTTSHTVINEQIKATAQSITPVKTPVQQQAARVETAPVQKQKAGLIKKHHVPMVEDVKHAQPQQAQAMQQPSPLAKPKTPLIPSVNLFTDHVLPQAKKVANAVSEMVKNPSESIEAPTHPIAAIAQEREDFASAIETQKSDYELALKLQLEEIDLYHGKDTKAEDFSVNLEDDQERTAIEYQLGELKDYFDEDETEKKSMQRNLSFAQCYTGYFVICAIQVVQVRLAYESFTLVAAGISIMQVQIAMTLTSSSQYSNSHEDETPTRNTRFKF